MVFRLFAVFPAFGACSGLTGIEKHLRCPYARVWLEHGAEKASEMLGMPAHIDVDEGAPVERCALASGFAGGAHQDARSPGYSSDCANTPAESSPYMWPLAFSFDTEETVMDWDADAPTAQYGTKTWYLLNKNWKRNDIVDGFMPGRAGTSAPDLERATILHRNEQLVFIQWKNGTDFKDVSTIQSCYSSRVPGIGNMRPDWFLDSRPYVFDDIASQYLGNQHIYHRGEPRLVKQWRKSDHTNDYFVMSLQEHAGADGIHWPLQLDIPGEGSGPDSMRSMYNHAVFNESDLDMFLVDQRYIAAGNACPSISPPKNESGWACTVCAYEYDAERDGEGVSFKDLPDDWVCPRCGSPKVAYKQYEAAGERLETDVSVPEGDVPSALTKDSIMWRDIEYTFSPVWVPPAPGPGPVADAYKCDICFHIYDPVKDGNGVKFEDLPSDWKCPFCGATKDHYKQEGEPTIPDTPTDAPPDSPGEDGSVAKPLIVVLSCVAVVGLFLIACSSVAKRRVGRSAQDPLMASSVGQSLQPVGTGS